MHRIYTPEIVDLRPDSVVQIQGDEANHALVKRLRQGEMVELLDGQGHVASAMFEAFEGSKRHPQVVVSITEVVERERPPLFEVLCPTPKGDRLAAMIDQLVQLGATSWTHVQTEFALGPPSERFLARAERAAIEAMKQCGRAWRLEIGTPIDFALASRREGLVVADGTGTPPGAAWPAANPPPSAVLIGPEGGFSEPELGAIESAGIPVVRLAEHTLRIETAAIAAAAWRATLHPRRPQPG